MGIWRRWVERDRSQRGATIPEYALIVAFFAVGSLGAIQYLETEGQEYTVEQASCIKAIPGTVDGCGYDIAVPTTTTTPAGGPTTTTTAPPPTTTTTAPPPTTTTTAPPPTTTTTAPPPTTTTTAPTTTTASTTTTTTPDQLDAGLTVGWIREEGERGCRSGWHWCARVVIRFTEDPSGDRINDGGSVTVRITTDIGTTWTQSCSDDDDGNNACGIRIGFSDTEDEADIQIISASGPLPWNNNTPTVSVEEP